MCAPTMEATRWNSRNSIQGITIHKPITCMATWSVLRGNFSFVMIININKLIQYQLKILTKFGIKFTKLRVKLMTIFTHRRKHSPTSWIKNFKIKTIMKSTMFHSAKRLALCVSHNIRAWPNLETIPVYFYVR